MDCLISPFAPRNPRSPTLARWRGGESLPTPVVVKIRASDFEWYATVCATCGQPNRTWASSCEYVVPGPAGAGRCGASLSSLAVITSREIRSLLLPSCAVGEQAFGEKRA